MKLLKDWTELEAGGIYNKIYVGNNAAYARINGKTTIRIHEAGPRIVYEELYYAYATPFYHEHLSNGPITSEQPEIAFREYRLYETENESEWIKHSTTCASLDDALSQGLITEEDIRRVGPRTSHFVPCMGKNMNLLGLYYSFNVEDKTVHPMLQSAIITWKTWDEMRNDFQHHGVQLTW